MTQILPIITQYYAVQGIKQNLPSAMPDRPCFGCICFSERAAKHITNYAHQVQEGRTQIFYIRKREYRTS